MSHAHGPSAPTAPSTRLLAGVAVLLLVVAAALVGLLSTRHGGPSSEGSLSSGACVVLTASSVRPAGCGTAHDGRVTGVLRQSYQACPPGSDEFDVTDTTGSLCVDRSQASH